MSDFGLIHYAVTDQQIREQVPRSRTPRLPGPHRPRGRHALAQRLHAFADRLDS